MANASVTQAINSFTIGKAIKQARQECANYPRWLNAVNKAAVELAIPSWQFDSDVLVIPSASNPSVKHTVSHNSCTCQAFAAGKPCKHRAAWGLLRKAAELAELPKPMPKIRKYSDAEWLAIAKRAEELFQ